MNSIASHQTDPFLPVPVPASGRNSASPARPAGARSPAADTAGIVLPSDRVTLSDTARAAGETAAQQPVQTSVAISNSPTTADLALAEPANESPLARQQIRLKYGLPGESIPNRETQPGKLLHIVI
jgi:hypothetical protein